MKWLVLSDSHGNRHGLEAVLARANECDKILCLGDIVGYGAFPNECCALLRERGAICLSGNHDAAVLGLISTKWFNHVASAAVGWTQAQLKPENREWLRSLPAQQKFPENGFQAVHASLRQPWEEYILSPDEALPNFLQMEQPVCFFGHTHVACCISIAMMQDEWRASDTQWLETPAGAEIILEEGELNLINPGSCGQPRDGVPLAKAAIWDDETLEIEIFTAPYDIEAARSAILNAGLPQSLGDRLREGH